MADATQRVALISGGSRGIGRAIVEALLAEHYLVGFCGRSEEGVAAALRDLDPRWPGRLEGTVVDVTDQPQVAGWIERAAARHGRLDCLVNNAGQGSFAPVDEMPPETFRRIVDTNLFGTFYGIAAAAKVMRRQGEGWIFNIGSLAAKSAFAGGAAYNASKFGLLGLSEASMLDLRHSGVRVTAVLPGSVDTEFHEERRPERDWMLAPADVAQVIVDLLRLPARALPSLVELRPSRPPKK